MEPNISRTVSAAPDVSLRVLGGDIQWDIAEKIRLDDEWAP